MFLGTWICNLNFQNIAISISFLSLLTFICYYFYGWKIKAGLRVGLHFKVFESFGPNQKIIIKFNFSKSLLTSILVLLFIIFLLHINLLGHLSYIPWTNKENISFERRLWIQLLGLLGLPTYPPKFLSLNSILEISIPSIIVKLHT